MRAIALPPSWGVDTSAKFTTSMAKALAAGRLPQPYDQPIAFLWRYVFFGPARPGDIDAAELDAIVGAGLPLMLVQHVRNPGWLASGDLGEADARAAVANALRAGYTAGVLDENGRPPSLAMDLEGVRNSGTSVFEHCKRWGNVVRGAGYSPVLYVGYDAGLTPEQLWQIPTIDRYWSDFGPRSVERRGFCCKQHDQITWRASTLAPFVNLDPDYAAPDALGGTLTALAA